MKMGKESTDMENMYEGKNIEIILDGLCFQMNLIW